MIVKINYKMFFFFCFRKAKSQQHDQYRTEEEHLKHIKPKYLKQKSVGGGMSLEPVPLIVFSLDSWRIIKDS